MAQIQFAEVLDFERGAEANAGDTPINRMLRAIRNHLGMDVAFASRATASEIVIEHADMVENGPFKVGDAFPIEDGYCKRIIDGRIPHLITDTSKVEEVAELECTRSIPVGAHMSVPLRLRDGRVYGTFCCFSFNPDRSLNQRDLQMLGAFAELAAGQIDDQLKEERESKETADRISGIIGNGGLSIVYQPIHHIATRRVVGVECLSRFPDWERRPPSDWFEEGAQVGLGVELEIAAINAALRGLPYLPTEAYLAVNVSPATVLSGRLDKLLREQPSGRIVLELTEHAAIADYHALAEALAPMRERAKLAIDDVGAGYAGMRHILDLKPDTIKLDMSLVRDIDKDPARRALAVALVDFAAGIGSEIVAEGVERIGELEALASLGVHMAQGYYLSRPMPLMAARNFMLGDRPQTDHRS